MAYAQTLGGWGEALAQSYFTRQGYKTLSRNYRVRGGEIDLIMCRGKQVLFVEVKTRRAGNRSSGPEDIHPRQVRRLLRLAEQYVIYHDVEEWQFVLVAVVLRQNKPFLRLLELTESI